MIINGRERQMYGRTYSSKKEFFNWLEENGDNIDWELDVELGWYYKEEEEEEDE